MSFFKLKLEFFVIQGVEKYKEVKFWQIFKILKIRIIVFLFEVREEMDLGNGKRILNW